MSNIFDTLPCEKKIDLLCKNIGSVFFYCDRQVSEKNRLYFLVGVDNDNLYFVHPQSEIDKRLAARKETRDNLITLVIVDKSDHPELRHTSVIDCNSIRNLTKDEIIELCKKNIFQVKVSCTDSFKQKIFSAIELSPRVSPNIKAVIKACS